MEKREKPMKNCLSSKDKESLKLLEEKKNIDKESLAIFDEIAQKSDVLILPIDRGFGIRAYSFFQVDKVCSDNPITIPIPGIKDESSMIRKPKSIASIVIENHEEWFSTKEFFTFEDALLSKNEAEKIMKDLFTKWCRSEKNLMLCWITKEHINKKYEDYCY